MDMAETAVISIITVYCDGIQIQYFQFNLTVLIALFLLAG